ncbi:sensor histidine kinase [Haloarcula onubensis]|uniref:histidine kinase n=1 Tax=Haloarcula onubensis TaxID=2950539 RepID=A0ABU2FTX0_9EURY|nr:GAF domain-containing sensor histidine kinase [Halomicroarcula sp. S3CR25-11]MDS0284203.1 GAF domain-containing sensor histidine kinase [Halomicroarcula sp. S3CR25-11]
MQGGDGVPTALDALYSVTQRLMRADSEAEICGVAVEAIPEVFAAPFGGLWLYDSETVELQLTAETERADRTLDGTVVYRPGNSLSWEAFEAGELRRIPEDAGDGTTYNDDSRFDSELILPLGDRGVLNIATEEADAFGRRDLQVARLFAANVESALARAQQEYALRVQNDRLEEFVSMVSHDLRNPLTVADGYLELARETGADDHLADLADALGRMDALIDDLLTLAEQGYVVESRTRLGLRALAEQAWANVQTRSATLRTDGTVDVFGDESRLLQVFENLFRNAVEHAGPDVTVHVGPLESLHTSTRVSAADYTDGFYVADDGPGIPAEDPSEVFASGHSTDGTGLGLAIVERVVEAHGWDISAGESVGRGARFEVIGQAKPVTPFQTE